MTTYEIKTSGKWEKVNSNNFQSLLLYCNNNNIKKYRFIGMQSKLEIEQNKYLREV